MKKVVITVGESFGYHEHLLSSVELIAVESLENLKKYYPLATHILLQGGSDINPGLYRAKRTFAVNINSHRDMLEHRLAYSALLHGKPILGICRGHQMVAVAAGGTLYQDLKKECGKSHPNNHWVQFADRCTLRNCYKSNCVVVNSFHHQAVKSLPKGLRAVAWAHDGIIEAMQGIRVLTVQWHPEFLLDDSSEMLYQAFLRMQPRKESNE